MDSRIILYVLFGGILFALILGSFVILTLPQQSEPPSNVVSVAVSKKTGIEVAVPKPNNLIISPLKITGTVYGGGWNGFEGQVGTVKLLDGNGKELASTFLKATSEWTKLPTSFEANMPFKIPATNNGSLVFHNENASGDPLRDKTVTLPIIFK